MPVQANTVLIQTQVSVVRESPDGRGGSSNAGSAADDAEVLGVLADCFCVRVASLDNMLPGSGFHMHNHACRWLKPIAGASKRGMLGVQKQCRVQ